MPLDPEPRSTALEVVSTSLKPGRDLQMVLDQALATVPDSRNRALITELAYGYLRYKGRLDFVIDSFLSRPGRLPSKLRTLMGLAGYELFFLDRIPEYATVSRAVDLAGRKFGSGMSSLVNAVLRRTAQVDIFDPAFFRKDSTSDVYFWSSFYSCPLWIINMWIRDFGPGLALEYLKQSLDKPRLGLRLAPEVQDLPMDPEYTVYRIGPSLCLKHGYPGLSDLEEKKLAFRQSFAGQKALWELNMPDWPAPVWDMCAGRGGKSLLMSGQGLSVWASDPSPSRLAGLGRQNIEQKQGIAVFVARGQDHPLKKAPRTVLMDAPCTGLGVLGRRPDIKWKRKPRDIKPLVRLQKELLDSAAGVLPVSGELVYLTCTLSKDENEHQIYRFLSSHEDFALLQVYRTACDDRLAEFFFAARMQRL